MKQTRRPFTVEIKSSRLRSARTDRADIWVGVDIKTAFEHVQRDLPQELAILLQDEGIKPDGPESAAQR